MILFASDDEDKRMLVQLRPYERHAACLLIALLLGLGIAGFEWGKVSHAEPSPTKCIKVIGAVDAAELKVPLGSTVDEILAKTVVHDDADLSEIDGTKKVVPQDILVVPYKGKKTFYICGAVREPTLVVIEGEVTAKKILEKVSLRDDANVKAFLRRRVFSNGSVIEVKAQKGSPCKTNEKKHNKEVDSGTEP